MIILQPKDVLKLATIFTKASIRLYEEWQTRPRTEQIFMQQQYAEMVIDFFLTLTKDINEADKLRNKAVEEVIRESMMEGGNE